MKVNLVEAGGYANPETQITQVESCVAEGAAQLFSSIVGGAVGLVDEIRGKGYP